MFALEVVGGTIIVVAVPATEGGVETTGGGMSSTAA
jgi:hypothetical protein